MSRAALQNRLRRYWKIEAANIVLVPAVGITIVLRAGGKIGVPLIVAILAAGLLLVIGAFALRAHFKVSQGEYGAMRAFVPVAARLQKPMLTLCIAAMVCACYALWNDGGFSPSGIAACIFATLAMLEYINYYVVQLQHFDNSSDFRRLIAGRGFRQSHLARAIARYRTGAQDNFTTL